MLLRLKKALHAPFPFYFNYWKHNFWLVVGMGIFVAGFLAYFQPGNLMSDDVTQIPIQIIGYTVIAFVVAMIFIVIVPSVFSKHFEPERWTFGKYLGYNLIIVMVIAFFNGLFNYVYLGDEFSIIQLITFDLRNTFMTALLALIPASYMIRTFMLKEYLAVAQATNRKLMAKQEALETKSLHIPKLVIESDTRERIEIPREKYLYAESEDNYAVIYWNQDGKLTNRMLRLSLSRLERQLKGVASIRCHRSFIVNLDHVTAINGNSNGLTLILDKGLAEVPVSRSHVQEVQEQLDGNSAA